MKFASLVGQFVVYVACIAISYAVASWGLQTLWGWFIAPAFNLPAISRTTAIGIMVVVGLLGARYDENTSKKSTMQQVFERMIFAILMTGTLVAIGWITLQFPGGG